MVRTSRSQNIKSCETSNRLAYYVGKFACTHCSVEDRIPALKVFIFRHFIWNLSFRNHFYLHSKIAFM